MTINSNKQQINVFKE